MAGPARSTSLETQQIVYTVERLENHKGTIPPDKAIALGSLESK